MQQKAHHGESMLPSSWCSLPRLVQLLDLREPSDGEQRHQHADENGADKVVIEVIFQHVEHLGGLGAL